MQANFRKLIEAIDARAHAPFAIWELRQDTGLSSSTVTRILNNMIAIDLVKHSPRAYAGRHYSKTWRWTNVEDVLETYTLARILRIGS